MSSMAIRLDTIATELRLEIYDYLLVLPEAVEFGIDVELSDRPLPNGPVVNPRFYMKKDSKKKSALHPAILRVCKKISGEAAEVLYSKYRFWFPNAHCANGVDYFAYISGSYPKRIPAYVPYTTPFLQQLGHINAGWIRHIRINTDDLIRASCNNLRTLEIASFPPEGENVLNQSLSLAGHAIHLLYHQGGLRHIIGSSTFEKITMVVGVYEEDMDRAVKNRDKLIEEFAGGDRAATACMCNTPTCAEKWVFDLQLVDWVSIGASKDEESYLAELARQAESDAEIMELRRSPQTFLEEEG